MNHFKFISYLIVVLYISAANAGPQEDLLKAVDIDAPQMATEALKQGADPNVRDAQGQHGLYLALRAGSMQVARILVEAPGTDLDAVNAAGETPLMMAALRGDLELTRLLLDRGGRLNRAGWTPLHYAASGPSPQVVALLLDRGAQINALSPNGTTPLMMAARYGAIDAADLLRQRGADRRLRNQRDMDAAEFARGAGRTELAARLAAP